MRKIFTLICLSILTGQVGAVDRYVTSTADSGPYTLRQAVLDALPGDNIYFDVNDTIVLTTGIGITKDNLTIDASAIPGGVVITLTTNGRIMTATSGVTSSLTIKNITFTGATLSGQSSGNSKGAAFRLYTNAKGVVFENCNFHNNKVISNFGPSGGGGVSVDNGADATFINCNFWENEAVNCVGGAALFIHGGSAKATLSNCSIYNNLSSVISSPFFGARGGAISCWDGILNIDNSTVSNNGILNNSDNTYAYAQGGAITFAQGTVGTITNCTVYENYIAGDSIDNEGGGFYLSGSSVTEFRNNIFGRNLYINTGTNDTIVSDCYAPLSSGGYNVMQNPVTTFVSVSTDIIGMDPALGELQSYNNSYNFYHPVLCSSPAWNAGDPAEIANDQLGNPRNQAGGVDAGAIEFQGPLPTISLSTTPVLCYGGSTGAVVIDNFNLDWNYLWSTGRTSKQIRNLEAGVYSVVVLDENGCEDSVGVTLTSGPEIVVDAMITAVCGIGNEGAIDLAASGGVGNFSFDWNNDGTGDFDDTEDLVQLSANTYIVTVKDQNDCTIEKSYEIEQVDELEALLSETNILCNGESTGAIDLTVSGAGDANYTVDWSNDGIGDYDDNEDLSGLSPGNYVVSVLSDDNCMATASVTLTEPTAIVITGVIQDDNGSGNGSVDVSVSGGVPSYSYSWDDLGGSITEDLSGLNAGTYTITVTDAASCSADKEFIVDGPITSVTGHSGTNGISLYPNPASSSASVIFSQQLNNVALYFLTGELITYFGSTEVVQLPDLTEGLYIIKSDEGVFKVVVE